MFEGIMYKDRNNPKPPDIVFPKSKFTKIIVPNNLVTYTSGKYGGWINENMPIGENGIYLTLIVAGYEINELMTIEISKYNESQDNAKKLQNDMLKAWEGQQKK